MGEPWTTLFTVATGAVGLEIVRFFLTRNQARRKDDRDDTKQVFDLASGLREESRKQESAIREELRKDMAVLREEIQTLRTKQGMMTAELDSWKERYYELFREYTTLHQQYVLVASTLDHLMMYLRKEGIEVPFEAPIIPTIAPINSPEKDA